MKTFVIPDIHGRSDLLKAAIRHIEDNYKKGGRIVYLGDYIDRGPDSFGVIEILINGPKNPDLWEWIPLKGNHEDMMYKAVRSMDPRWIDVWLSNGGTACMSSYPGARILDSHLDWIKSLKLFHADQHRVYVHAAVDERRELHDQVSEYVLWERYRRGDNQGYRGRMVVHGHTPVEKPVLLDKRVNLDTGAYHTGVLSVGVFDDDSPSIIKVINIKAGDEQ